MYEDKKPSRIISIKKDTIDNFLQIMSVDTEINFGDVHDEMTKIIYKSEYKLFDDLSNKIYLASNNNIKIDYLQGVFSDDNQIKSIRIYWHFSFEDEDSNKSNKVEEIIKDEDCNYTKILKVISNNTSNDKKEEKVKNLEKTLNLPLYKNYSPIGVISIGFAFAFIDKCRTYTNIGTLCNSDKITITLTDVFKKIKELDNSYVLDSFKIKSYDNYVSYAAKNEFIYTNDVIESQKMVQNPNFEKPYETFEYRGIKYATPDECYLIFIGDMLHNLNHWATTNTLTSGMTIKLFKTQIKTVFENEYPYLICDDCSIIQDDDDWLYYNDAYKTAKYHVYLNIKEKD